MPLVLTKEVIKPLRNSGGDVRLVALLTYVSRNIPDDNQLFTTPDFQRGCIGPQFTAADVTPINCVVHFLTFRVL
jgi:hypothetical protein